MVAELHLREIKPTDVTSKLSLGSPEFIPLKTFLKNSALDFHQNNIAKTYVLVEDISKAQVWGYASLMSSEVALDIKQRPEKNLSAKKNYEIYIPQLKLQDLLLIKICRVMVMV